VLDAMRLYLRYAGVSIRAQMQYRSAFLVAAFGQLLIIAVEFTGVWALFSRFGKLPGWSFAQVAFLYGFANSAFAVSDAVTNGFEYFGTKMLRTGDFDRLLLRPRSTVLQLAGQELALRRVGRLSTGVAILLWAAAELALTWDVGRAALFAFALIGAVCFFYAVTVLHGALAFWTTESLEVMHVFSHGGVETAQYPITIYAPWFRRFFTFVVPLACVVYFPLVAVLDRDDPLGSPRWLQICAPSAGPLFLLVAIAAWRRGVRRYTSTGS
jgi:ABC-2 type transport system permease protein